MVSSLAARRVHALQDGGMGSLRFETREAGSIYGSTMAEAQFVDRDGVPVLVSVYADQFGDLFELDVWRVDFHPLQSYPADVGELVPLEAADA